MKKKSKLKLRYKLLILAALAAPPGAYVSYKVAQRVYIMRINSWRAEGIAASKSGDHAAAADLLTRYLRRRPEDVDALEVYAHSRELAEEPNGQHLAETAIALKAILGLEPDRIEDRRHLMELYYRIENRIPAYDTAQAILRKHPDDIRAWRIQTEMLTAVRQFRPALDSAIAWTTRAPQDLQAHLNRLRLRGLLAQPIQQILDDAAEVHNANQNDPKFELIHGYAYMLAADLEGNDQQKRVYEDHAAKFLQAAAKHPDLPDDVATSLVDQFDHLGLAEDALKLMETIAKSGHNPAMQEALAKRYWDLSRWKDAADAMAAVDPASDATNPTLIGLKAIACEYSGNKDDAAKCRAALASRNQAAARVWSDLLKRSMAAQPSTAPTLTAESSGKTAAEVSADDKQLVADCRSALAVNPDNPYINYFLGDAQARMGEMDLAMQAWRNAVSLDLNWPMPSLRLIDILLQRGRADEALRIATTTARRASGRAVVAVALARAWSASIETGTAGHSEELFKLVEELHSQMPDDEQTMTIRVNLLARRGQRVPADHDTAVTIAKAAIAKTPPPSQPTLIALASISQRFSLGIDDECFATALKSNGPNPILAYATAAAHVSKIGAAEGLKMFDDLAARSGKATDLQWKLARANYLDIAGLPDAAAAWKTLSQENPKDRNVQKAVISARALRGDWATLEPAIARLKDLAPDNAVDWRLAKARLMIDSPRTDADYEQASVLLADIIKKNPRLSEPEELMGRALVQMKRTDAALEHLAKAVQLDPGSVPLALEYASLLQSNGDFDRVTEELNRVIPSLRTAGERRRAALLLAQQGKSEAATKLLEQDPDAEIAGQTTEEDDILLANLYAQQHRFDKTDAIVTKLLTNPTLPSIRFATGYYMARNQFDKSQQTLKLLDKLKLDPGVKEGILGSYAVQTGDYNKAEELYGEVTRLTPTNALAWRLYAAMQVALNHTPDAMKTIETAAKVLPNDESFKILLAQSATVRQFADDSSGRSIVVAAIRDSRSTAVAMDLLHILADWRTSNDAERAANQLQQFVTKNPTFLPARTQLVNCLAGMSRYDDAITIAQQAVTAFPSDPEPARVAVQIAAAGQRWQTMRQLADTWRKRVVANTIPAELAIAQADLGLHDYSSVAQRMQPYLAKAMITPDDPNHTDILVTYAVATQNSEPNAAVVDKLWQLAKGATDWRIRWIRMASEIQDTAAAVAWLDRAATIVPPDAANENLALAQMYEGLGDARQSEDASNKASAIFAKLIAMPDPTADSLVWAAAHAEHVKDLPGAIALYRRTLQKDPSSPIAQNNLAVLLARSGQNLPDARTMATDVVAKHPHSATFRDSLALVQSKSGDLAAAVDSINVAIKLEPDNAAWRVRLAGYQFDQGNRIEATKTLAEVDSRRLDLRKLAPDVKNQLDTLRKSLRGTAGA